MEDFTEQDDRWLRDALQSASAPAGLRERIRSSLRQEAAAQLSPRASSPALLGDSPEASRAKTAAAATTIGPSTSSSEQVELPRATPPTARHRRWVGLALALSAAVLLIAGLQWSRPYSVEQLAQHSLQQLELVLREDATWNSNFSEHFSELAILDEQLRGHVEPVGFQNRPGEPIARHCRVWKLYSNTTHKAFYVFDFQDAHQVQQLTSQLQAINRVSGGWSMFAMRSADRVVVVLLEGVPDDYLYRLQAA